MTKSEKVSMALEQPSTHGTVGDTLILFGDVNPWFVSWNKGRKRVCTQVTLGDAVVKRLNHRSEIGLNRSRLDAIETSKGE